MAKPKNNAAQGNLLKKAPLPKMPEGYYSGDKPNPNLRNGGRNGGPVGSKTRYGLPV